MSDIGHMAFAEKQTATVKKPYFVVITYGPSACLASGNFVR